MTKKQKPFSNLARRSRREGRKKKIKELPISYLRSELYRFLKRRVGKDWYSIGTSVTNGLMSKMTVNERDNIRSLINELVGPYGSFFLDSSAVLQLRLSSSVLSV